jgi:hypothetical protein
MEKIHSISDTHKLNKALVQKGYYIALECCMCRNEETIVGDTQDDTLKNMTDAGWRDIDSDMYGVTGYYCGCDYKD